MEPCISLETMNEPSRALGFPVGPSTHLSNVLLS